MYFHFKVHKEGTRFWAECLELECCVTEADTWEELLVNIPDALETCLEDGNIKDFKACICV